MLNIVVISEENRILHITNYGYEVHYVVYNTKADILNDGVLESVYSMFDSYKVIDEVIKLVQENISFHSPFIYMYGQETDFILRLINIERKKKDKTVLNYIRSLYDKSDFLTFYRERMEYGTIS